jgi:polyphosphate kinase
MGGKLLDENRNPNEMTVYKKLNKLKQQIRSTKARRQQGMMACLTTDLEQTKQELLAADLNPHQRKRIESKFNRLINRYKL